MTENSFSITIRSLWHAFFFCKDNLLLSIKVYCNLAYFADARNYVFFTFSTNIYSLYYLNAHGYCPQEIKGSVQLFCYMVNNKEN